MAAPPPLGPPEERLWRALAELVTTLPRALDEEFIRDTGLTMTEYSVLVALSESPSHELRLSDLAASTALSLSRISRVVGDMHKRGLVRRRPCPADGRSTFAVLTDRGLAMLESAYPGHLQRVRAFVFDHLDEDEIDAMGPLIERMACAVRRRGVEPLQ